MITATKKGLKFFSLGVVCVVVLSILSFSNPPNVWYFQLLGAVLGLGGLSLGFIGVTVTMFGQIETTSQSNTEVMRK